MCALEKTLITLHDQGLLETTRPRMSLLWAQKCSCRVRVCSYSDLPKTSRQRPMANSGSPLKLSFPCCLLQVRRVRKLPLASLPQLNPWTHLAWPSPVVAPSSTKLSPAGLLPLQLPSLPPSTTHCPPSQSRTSPPATSLLSSLAGDKPSRRHHPATPLTYPRNRTLQAYQKRTLHSGQELVTCLR